MEGSHQLSQLSNRLEGRKKLGEPLAELREAGDLAYARSVQATATSIMIHASNVMESNQLAAL
jgi:hypothetical protein